MLKKQWALSIAIQATHRLTATRGTFQRIPCLGRQHVEGWDFDRLIAEPSQGGMLERSLLGSTHLPPSGQNSCQCRREDHP